MATAQPKRQQQQGSTAAAATATAAKRKPVFVKVEDLKPGTNGHTLTVKVLTAKTVLQKGRAASANLRQTKIAECLVGDETGTIIFAARNEQGNVSDLDLDLSSFSCP